MQIVYADVLLIINFSMDFLILTVTCKLLKHPLKPIRITVASVLGAVYSLLEFLWITSIPFLQFVFNVAVSFLMCCICTTGKLRIRALFTAVFYFMCFAVGGGIAAIYSLSGSLWNITASGRSYYFDISLWQVALISSIALGLSFIVPKLINNKLNVHNAALKIKLGDIILDFNAFVDSGCMVKEPITNSDVVFVRSPQNISDNNARICYIPVNTVAGKKVFKAIRPDELYCNNVLKKAVVIFDDDDSIGYGEYDAIIPISLI